jgi:hypothetical protein
MIFLQNIDNKLIISKLKTNKRIKSTPGKQNIHKTSTSKLYTAYKRTIPVILFIANPCKKNNKKTN